MYVTFSWKSDSAFPWGIPLCILYVHVWVQIWPTQFIIIIILWNLESSLFYTVIDIYFDLELIKYLLFGLMLLNNCIFVSYRHWSRSCHHTSWMNSGHSLLSNPPPLPHPQHMTSTWLYCSSHLHTVPCLDITFPPSLPFIYQTELLRL